MFPEDDCVITSEKPFQIDSVKHCLSLGVAFNNEHLTKRELDVLQGILLGYTAKKIAQELQLSFRTVEAYIETLKWKLACAKKADIITVAMCSGLYRVFFK